MSAFLRRILGLEPPALPDVTLTKVADQRIVYGWASVATERGTPVIDREGDVMELSVLQKGVHAFMQSRALGVMHNDVGLGEVVDSIVLTADVQKALGVDLRREGWFVGVHVTDDATWARVQSGELRAFSLGGVGGVELLTKRYDDGAMMDAAPSLSLRSLRYGEVSGLEDGATLRLPLPQAEPATQVIHDALVGAMIRGDAGAVATSARWLAARSTDAGAIAAADRLARVAEALTAAHVAHEAMEVTALEDDENTDEALPTVPLTMGTDDASPFDDASDA
jgi:hypothetical protein